MITRRRALTNWKSSWLDRWVRVHSVTALAYRKVLALGPPQLQIFTGPQHPGWPVWVVPLSGVQIPCQSRGNTLKISKLITHWKTSRNGVCVDISNELCKRDHLPILLNNEQENLYSWGFEQNCLILFLSFYVLPCGWFFRFLSGIQKLWIGFLSFVSYVIKSVHKWSSPWDKNLLFTCKIEFIHLRKKFLPGNQLESPLFAIVNHSNHSSPS